MTEGNPSLELYLACEKGDFEKVKFLVTGDLAVRGEPLRGNFEPGNKADITAQENRPLWSASYAGHLDIVKFLVENKADIISRDNGPILMASANGHLETVKFLLENRANVEADNNFPIRTSSLRGRLDMVKFLVENKADITAEDNRSVRNASRHGHLEIVKFLLSKGADFNMLTSEHQIYFRSLKWFRRWRFVIFLRRLFQIALPLYYSPGFPGYFRGRKRLEKFVGKIEDEKE